MRRRRTPTTSAVVNAAHKQPDDNTSSSKCRKRIIDSSPSCCDVAVASSHPNNNQRNLGRRTLADPSRAIAPLAIIGGTYTVYSSALHHSNNTHLTPHSLLYLLLLAFNYAIMPRLSKKYIHPQTNKQSVALVEELVKMGLGMGGWIVTAYCQAASSYSTSNNKSLHVDNNRQSHEDANHIMMQSSSSWQLLFSSFSSNIESTLALLSRQLQNYSFQSTLLAAGIPSALYALQGILTYTSYQNLDAVTYNGLTQLKVLSSALCCYLVLGQRQSLLQVLSLGIVMMSTIVFQGGWRDWFGNNETRHENNIDVVVSETDGGTTTLSRSDGTSYYNNRRLLLGVLPCIGATLLSGLAGVFSQRSLQSQAVGGIGYNNVKSMMHRDAYFYTIEISLLSALCLAFSMVMEYVKHCITAKNRRSSRAHENIKDSDNDNNNNHPCTSTTTTTTQFFEHWTYATLLPITAKASAGLLTALVHRHLGSVIKGFALVLGLVFSALLQFVIEGDDLTGGQVVGTVMVLLGSWLHFTNGPKRHY